MRTRVHPGAATGEPAERCVRRSRPPSTPEGHGAHSSSPRGARPGAASLILLVGCADPSRHGGGAGSARRTRSLPTGTSWGRAPSWMSRARSELCLGPVAESYPPQCSGIPLEGWSWEGVEGSETSGDVRWGTYAVQGTYDGESLTVTAPPDHARALRPDAASRSDGRRARRGRRGDSSRAPGGAARSARRRVPVLLARERVPVGRRGVGRRHCCRMPRMPSSATTPSWCAPRCVRWSSTALWRRPRTRV